MALNPRGDTFKQQEPKQEPAEQPVKQEQQKSTGDVPEPVSQEALDEGRVQPNPDTEGMSLEDEKKLADEQKKNDEETKTVLKSIVDSNEGYILRNESNANQVDSLADQQFVYVNNVQSGKGGYDVEERVYLTESGYSKTR
jgi:hypothetical protein